MNNHRFERRCNCQKTLTYYQMENRKVKIILDPGHGGDDTGDQINGIYEKDLNMDFAFRVGELLTEQGYEVIYTRVSDVFVPETEKKELADNSGADLFLSLHRISHISYMDRPGVEAIVIEPNELEMETAGNLTRAFEDMGFINLGVIQSRSYSSDITNYDIPQVILLTGIYRDENNEFVYNFNIDEITEATVEGLNNTFKVQTQSKDKSNRYQVQVNRCRTYDEAKELQHLLYLKGYPSEVVKVQDFYCVNCGDYEDLDQAAAVECYFKKEKYNPMIVIK